MKYTTKARLEALNFLIYTNIGGTIRYLRYIEIIREFNPFDDNNLLADSMII